MCSEIEVFCQEKGHICCIYQISDSRHREKTGKIESMTKKGRQKYWSVKWNLFPKKGHSKNVPSPKLGAKSPSLLIHLRPAESKRLDSTDVDR